MKKTHINTIAIVNIYIILAIVLMLFSFIIQQGIAYVSLLLLIGFFVFLSMDRRFFLASAYILISIIWVAVSNYYIELGNYISEQRMYGVPTGATARYVAFSLVFLASAYTAYLVLSAFENREAVHSDKKNNFFIFNAVFFSFVAVYFAVYIYISLNYGLPVFIDIDRYTYWSRVPNALVKIKGFSGYLYLLIGIYLSLQTKSLNKLFSGLVFFALTISLISFGEKFSPIFIGILFFALGYYGGSKVNEFKLFAIKPILITITVVAIMVALVIYNYHYTMGIALADVYSHIINRVFGLQGHVWYGVDRRLTEGVILSQNSMARFADTGLVDLMYLIAPTSLVDTMREYGITFTMGYPAISIYLVGYGLAFFLQLPAGAMTGIVLYYLVLKLRKLQPVRLFAAFLGLRGIVWAFMMGDVFSLFKWYMVIFYIILVLDLLLQSKDIIIVKRMGSHDA